MSYNKAQKLNDNIATPIYPEKEEESAVIRWLHDFKAKRPDIMVLFHVGDFYEVYEHDARDLNKILDVTLTWSNDVSPDYQTYKGASAMFPRTALDRYLPMLIRAGQRVCIKNPEDVKENIIRKDDKGIRMMVFDRVSQLTADEKALICQLVTDHQTGHYLLSHERPAGYDDIRDEYNSAIRALNDRRPLSDRQRDILLECSSNYHGGLSDFADELNISEGRLRQALIFDPVKEHREQQNFHLFEYGLFWYVDSKAGFGLNSDYVTDIAIQTYYGEAVERDGRMMMRFATRDDAVGFISQVSMLNERHTNALRDGLIEKMRRAGIDVNTDWQEGERVLNNVNLKANSERNGAFSGDSSTNSKSFEGKVHLHRSSLSDSKDFAKLQKKTETTKQIIKKIKNEGGFNIKSNNVLDVLRNIGKRLKFSKSPSTITYYGDFIVGGENSHSVRIRLSHHPAKGEKMGNVNADEKISIVIYKDGLHQEYGDVYGKYSEWVYDPRYMSFENISSNILNGLDNLLNNGEYIDSDIVPHIYENKENQLSISFSQFDLEEKIGPRLTMNNYNVIRKINPFMSFLWSDKIPEFIDYREAVPVPTFDDYFVATRADFEYIGSHIAMQPGALITAEHENQQRWTDMVASGKYEHQKSPRSNSEYLLDHETGDIYRFSNHWGRVASCQWSIDTRYGTEDTEIYGIGKCNIKDFKPVSSERRTHNPAYAAPYADALQKTIINYETLLNSHVEISDAARQRIETRLESYRKLQTLFNEKGYTESRYMLVPDSQSPIFVSNALLALNKIKQEKATPEQWLKMLEKNGGIKAGEDRWTGLSQWLKDSQEKVLTKAAISAYLSKNMIQVEEVHYANSIDYSATPKFKEYQKEYDDIKEHLDDYYREADKQYESFMNDMQNKYGSDWADLMDDREAKIEERLLDERDKYAYYSDDDQAAINGLAFGVMMNRYGDDFEIAFGYDDSGYLYVANEDCASMFIDAERPINDIRLNNTTIGLSNKREIALTVPSVRSYIIGGQNGDIHFDDADDGRAIAWVRFGDAVNKRPLTDAEVAAELQKLPTANQWEKVDGSNFVTKRDVYFAPGTRNDVGHNYIVDRDGRFYVEMSTQYLRHHISSPFNKEGYATLAEAVDAYNRWQVSRMTMDEKVLVIDEIQSKRHQDGREKGYLDIVEEDRLKNNYLQTEGAVIAYRKSLHEKYPEMGDIARLKNIGTPEEYAQHTELTRLSIAAERALIEYRDKHGVPDAPFEKNWQDLCMKRMLRYAAENGYDRVAWLNGKQQADRYDLGKVVDRVTVNAPDDNGKRKVALQPVEDSSGHIDMMYFSVDKDGIVYSNSNPDWIERHVSEVVGKPLADKIMSAEEFTVYEGNDLRVGIYGMKAFYDEMLPSFMNKYGKQWGVHVEDMDIPSLQREDSSDGVALHGVKVTEQMKQDVLQGQPMFFRSGAHQAYGFVHNGTIYIDPRIATAETPLHEYTHLWAEVLRQRNPQEWQNIVQMMKDTPEVWNYVKQNYSHLKTDNQIADEALAHFSGQRGYKKLQDFVDGKENADSIFSKMMEVLGKFWSSVAEFFNIHYTNKEEVADRILYDLLNEVNILDYKIKMLEGLRENISLDNDSYLSNKSVVESSNFINWFGDWQLVAQEKTLDLEKLQEEYENIISLVPFQHHDAEEAYDDFVKDMTEKYGVYWRDSLTDTERHEEETLSEYLSCLDTEDNDINEIAFEILAHRHGYIPEQLDAFVGHEDGMLYSVDLSDECSKVVDDNGKPLVVEHATRNQFTKFDISHLGENSLDKGAYGSGFYFGTHAPGWMEGARVMKVYLDIKYPFELVSDMSHLDAENIYSYFADHFDHEHLRGLVMTDYGRSITVGEYIDAIRAIDHEIAEGRHDEGLAANEEIQVSYKPSDRMPVYRERLISERTGFMLSGSLSYIILDFIGSEPFTEALQADGFDGVIVDRGEGYKEYVAFEPNQIKSATDNIGLFSRDNTDIRFHFIGEQGAFNLDNETGTNAIDMLHHATVMEQSGSSPKDIKVVTGWERGTDEHWRYEISGIRDFDIRGNIDWLAMHPEVSRYLDLLSKENAYLFGADGAQPLSEKESEEYASLKKLPLVRYYNPSAIQKNPDRLTLKDYLDAPQLFAAYPSLKDLPVKLSAMPEGKGGSLVSSEDWLGETINERVLLNRDTVILARDMYNVAARTAVMNTIIHEAQHAIENIEGFAHGGSVGQRVMLEGEALRLVKEELSSLENNEEYVAWQQADNIYRGATSKLLAVMEHEGRSLEAVARLMEEERLAKRDAYMLYSVPVRRMEKRIVELHDILDNGLLLTYDNYKRLAGETEARNVVTRSAMTDEQRRNTLASETEDIPRKEQIVTYENTFVAADMASEVVGLDKDLISYKYSKALSDAVEGMAKPDSKVIAGYEDPASGEYVFVGNFADALSRFNKFFGSYLYGNDMSRPSEFRIDMSDGKTSDKFSILTANLISKGHSFAIVTKDKVQELLQHTEASVTVTSHPESESASVDSIPIETKKPSVVSAVQLDLFAGMMVNEDIPQTVSSPDLSAIALPSLSEGETCYVERRYSESGAFSFVGGDHIETSDDVAYIFKSLADKSVENSFICMVKDGIPTVIHLGIGSSVACMTPIEQALVAAAELKPEKVWFIHNHPSGSLTVSREDVNQQKRMVNIFGVAAQPGIIINTTSGKYVTYTSEADILGESQIAALGNGDKPVKVWSFDRQVFSKDWNPDISFKAVSPASIAAFVSSHRYGDRDKLSLIIVNPNSNVTGNIFLPWTDIKDACTPEGVALIARYVQQMGGNGCILYGSDNAMINRETKSLNYLSSHLRQFSISLHDVMSVANDNYYSALEQGILTPYASERSVVKEAAAEEQAVSPETFKPGDIIITLPDSTGARKVGRVDKVDDKLFHYTVSNGYIMVGQSANLELSNVWRLATDEEKAAFLAEEQRVLATESGQEQQRRQSQSYVAPRRLTLQDREAGGAMVDHLQAMGITVNTDNRVNRRILKDAQKDQSEAGKVRHFKTEQGESYGFAYKGEIHLDLRKIDAELPLHEYAHLWCESLRRINPDNWNSVVEMMKQDADTWNFVKTAYPELCDDNDLAEEVIAHYSGKRGAAKLQAELERMTPRDANYGSRWGNIFQNVSKAIQDFWKHVGDSLNFHYDSKEDLADQILNDFAKQVNPVKKIEKWLAERDKEYAAAVEAGDIDKSRDLFWDALKEHVGNGITPFMAVDGYRGKLDQLAHAVKDENNTEAINKAADLMAPFVRSGMVLVPAPGHEGYATSTLALANAIAERASVFVADVLKSDPRESQYDYKYAHDGKAMSADALGIRMEGELPADRLPVVIDNVVHSGNTAEACVKALGKGVVLSLASAVSLDRHVASLKSLAPVVYDKDGQLIPLSKRFELRNAYLGKVMNYRPIDDVPQEHTKKTVQGLEGYDIEDLRSYIRNSIQEILDDEYYDKDIYIKEVIIIGSRSRGEAHDGSDLDVLLEYGGKDVREDSLYNILHDADSLIDIEGITVDINPINEYYSLNTAQWLERDALWRAEDQQSQNIKEPIMSKSDKKLSQEVLNTLLASFKEAKEAHPDDVVLFRHDGLFTAFGGDAAKLSEDVAASSETSSFGEESITYLSLTGEQLRSLMEEGNVNLRIVPDAVGVSRQQSVDVEGLSPVSSVLSQNNSEQSASLSDVLLRADELGIGYHPVLLFSSVEDAASDIKFQYATVESDDVKLYRSLYDVFDHNAGLSISELPVSSQKDVLNILFDRFFAEDKQMTVVYDRKDIPDYAIPAIVNGDFSGIDNEQDEKDIRAFMDKNAGCIYDIQPGSECFIPFPAFGKGADCESVFMLRNITPKELLQEKREVRQESVVHDEELSRDGDRLSKGLSVVWYDPEDMYRDLKREYTIDSIIGGTIYISDDNSQVEVAGSELRLAIRQRVYDALSELLPENSDKLTLTNPVIITGSIDNDDTINPIVATEIARVYSLDTDEEVFVVKDENNGINTNRLLLDELGKVEDILNNKEYSIVLSSRQENDAQEEKPYTIQYGTFPGPEPIFGDVHLMFKPDVLNVTFCEQEEIAKLYGGEMRVQNGLEWADFAREDDAVKFADAVVALNKQREEERNLSFTENNEMVFENHDRDVKQDDYSRLESTIAELVGKGKKFDFSEPAVIDDDENTAKDVVDSVSVSVEGDITLHGRRIDNQGITASFELSGRDEYSLEDLGHILDSIKWDLNSVKAQSLSSDGMAHEEDPQPEAAVDVPSEGHDAEQPEKKAVRWDNLDYSKYVIPEGVTVEHARMDRHDPKEGERYPSWTIRADINGKHHERTMYGNDIKAFFEKDEHGKRSGRVTLDQLVVKYFGKHFADSMSIGSVQEAEHVLAEQKEKEQQKSEQEQQDKVKAEVSKKEKKEKVPAIILQSSLLVGALAAARDNDGVILNGAGKASPMLFNSQQSVSPFNALMMSLHSDANGYKTNCYTTFNAARGNGFSVRSGQSGLPFNWYNWDKYVNRFNVNEVITKEAYDNLDPEEKELYKILRTKEERSIFNIDQTSMSEDKKNDYDNIVSERGQVIIDEEPVVDKEASLKKQYDNLKAKHPEAVLLFRSGDFYEAFEADAETCAKVLGVTVDHKPKDGEAPSTKNAMVGFPYHALDSYLPKLICAGNRVAICDQLVDPRDEKLRAKVSDIYDKGMSLVDALLKMDNVNKDMYSGTSYDTKEDRLYIYYDRTSVPGKEISTALCRLHDLYSTTVAFTGAESRLNRIGRAKMLPSDVQKYDRLVQELSTAVLMSRHGYPVTLSKDSMELISYWQRELTESPSLVDVIERDVNNAVDVVDKIARGEAIDYAAMRGEKSIEVARPKVFTIASELATIPSEETKNVVIVKDEQKKSAAVILPAGASLEVNNEIPGMNKNRFVIALRKQGFEDVKFYNAGGALGLNQSNDFFADKSVEIAQLKQYELIVKETFDLTEEIARTSKVDIYKVEITQDDKGHQLLYVKPVDAPCFTVYPEPSDIAAFFRAFNTPDFDTVRENIAQKYCTLVQRHPELKVNVLMPEIDKDVDVSRISKVVITKDKYKKGSTIIFATINDEPQKPVELTNLQARRYWLVEDRTLYGQALACNIWKDQLLVDKGQSEDGQAQFRGNSERSDDGRAEAEEAKIKAEDGVQEEKRRGITI